jgi:hypothetical protein
MRCGSEVGTFRISQMAATCPPVKGRHVQSGQAAFRHALILNSDSVAFFLIKGKLCVVCEVAAFAHA